MHISLLACSGPGAAEAIAVSGQIALLSWALVFLVFLSALLVPALRRRFGWGGVAVLFACTLLHPALIFGTLRGDCGYTARFGSLIFLPLHFGLCVFLIWRRRGQAAAAAPSGA